MLTTADGKWEITRDGNSYTARCKQCGKTVSAMTLAMLDRYMTGHDMLKKHVTP